MGEGFTALFVILRAQECNVRYLLEADKLGTKYLADVLESHFCNVAGVEARSDLDSSILKT